MFLDRFFQKLQPEYILRKLVTSILLLVTISTLACDCAPIKYVDRAIENEYKFVDDVFIGDVKWIDDDSTYYEIIVCEVFKGDLRPGQKIKGINKGLCGPYVFKTGEWILLGTYSNEFKVHDCGLTTNLAEPWNILPPPPSPETESELGQNLLDKWKAESRQKVNRQIETLRKIASVQAEK